MAATTYRQQTVYTRPAKIMPVTLPSKSAPRYTTPVTRVAIDPPELDDSSTIYSGTRASDFSTPSLYSSRSGRDYNSRADVAGVDVMDELAERMSTVFDPIRMDRSLAKQAQTSGELNAKERQLAELRAKVKNRSREVRVTFAEAEKAHKEASEDLEYSSRKISAMKSRAKADYGDEYENARSSRRRR